LPGGEQSMPGPEELESIFGAVKELVTDMVAGLIGVLFSEETARSLSKAASTFYKDALDRGIPAEHALEMTKSYLAMMDVNSIFKAGGFSLGKRVDEEAPGEES